ARRDRARARELAAAPARRRADGRARREDRRGDDRAPRASESRWYVGGRRHARRGSRARRAPRRSHARWSRRRRSPAGRHMTLLLALRNLVLRPWRSAFLLLGYSLGVGVMVVLLSIGEALLAQARNEKLVGGGDITVLPEGIDVEVLKTGGLGGMFFSIDHARFIYAQLLAAPRLSPFVEAVAPQIEGKLLYARTQSGREIPVLASGEIPSRTLAVGAGPSIA